MAADAEIPNTIRTGKDQARWPGRVPELRAPLRGRNACLPPALSSGGRISDLLKFLVPKVGESFVLDHNVESQEVAQAKPRPELAGALETILELAAL